MEQQCVIQYVCVWFLCAGLASCPVTSEQMLLSEPSVGRLLASWWLSAAFYDSVKDDEAGSVPEQGHGKEKNAACLER